MALLYGKTAQMGGGIRRPVSLLLSLIFLAFGIVPLLNFFGVIAFSIPIKMVGLILWILATVGGVFLLWNVLVERMPTGIESHVRMASIGVALALLALGLIPILNEFGVIGFSLPSFADIIKNILFTVVGVLLLYGSTKQF